jgi:tetratricopeptide (TPR) repeat protein
LVLQATIQQSRHEFAASLATLDHALAVRPGDAQALLIRATVLRVLGRYPEASAACERFSHLVESRLAALCVQSLRGLSGQLESAYASLAPVSTQGWLNSEKSWLYSELGEMAVRLGRDQEAERWFQQDLRLSPSDFYVRAAYADLMLQQDRAQEALALLRGQESLEPLLLRIAIAQKHLRDPALAESSARLRAAFAAEMQRGEVVHRREQARFLLDIENQPSLSLAVALDDWDVQHEPDDLLILVRAATAAGNPRAALPAISFARAQGQSDVRVAVLTPAISASR